ncbi:cytochrome c [Rufibacter sp. H-1]|uniref:Cytochrome c n=2 Tax=Rufibacter sediminis TaxID=2762756 RepID=A0ABR6VQ18_9BACT|nr:cytochrome c [Rufibacter sediminis]
MQVVVIMCAALFSGCSSEQKETASKPEYTLHEDAVAEAEKEAADNGFGVGPVKNVEVGTEIDQALATSGKAIFDGKCTACHQLSDQKVVGPGLAGVTERRKPEWIMNMIVNPEEMTKKDPTAKKLLAEHLTQMTNQNVTESDARAILEYLRQNDSKS